MSLSVSNVAVEDEILGLVDEIEGFKLGMSQLADIFARLLSYPSRVLLVGKLALHTSVFMRGQFSCITVGMSS